jgi:exodeoxyribonuclease III
VALLRAQDADFVALVEANSRDNAQVLARQLGVALTYGEANCPSAVAWLSRFPRRRIENHRTPALAKTLLELEAIWEGRPLHLLATHLGSRWNAQRAEEEVVAILDIMSGVSDELHMLVGDLNALRPNDPVGRPPLGEAKRGDAVDGAPRLTIRRVLNAGYVDCYRRLHPAEPGYTYPAQRPWLRLDYIFASPEFATSVALRQSRIRSTVVSRPRLPRRAVREIQCPTADSVRPTGRL